MQSAATARDQTGVLNYNPSEQILDFIIGMCKGEGKNPYSCDLERQAGAGVGLRGGGEEWREERRDAVAFKVSRALNVWQTGVKHSRAERSAPLCQPIGNEFGARPVSHDSVFYGPR